MTLNETKPVLPTKPPSKILGPLLVYANDKNESSSGVHPPKLEAHEENPYYQMGQEFHEVTDDNYSFDYNEGPVVKHKNKHKPGTKGTKPEYPYVEQGPKRPPPPPTQIAIHGKGDADELLQFINQHPELTNYPSGSVFEIHNVPDNQRPSVPLIFEQPTGHPSGIPPGLNVDHVLQHIHKHPSQPFIPFPHHPDGHLFVTAPRPNSTTQPGWLR